MKVKCYDVVSMVIKEVETDSLYEWRRDEEKLEILKNYCEGIDFIAEECRCTGFDAEVDMEDGAITIRFECADFVVESNTNTYYDLIKRSVTYGFRVSESGDLLVEFTFPSVWIQE